MIEDLEEVDGRRVALSRLRWVRLAHYCKASGDTPSAVHARRKKRQWTDGVQCRLAPDGNVWVNLDEVNRWVEGQPPGGTGKT
jgi:hypothetical protein